MTGAQTHQRPQIRLGRRWWVLPVTLGLTLLAVAAWGIVASRPRLPSAGPAPAWAQPAKADRQPGAQKPVTARSADAWPPASRPPIPAMPAVLPMGAQSVSIPSVQVSAPAEPESVTAAGLGVPDDPAHVGWWMPTTSELVVDGHVDMERAGPGALYQLRDLHPGAQVTVQGPDGPEHWTMNGVRTYTKGRLPSGLFRWTGSTARLVLITCGGPFDYATHHYYDNVVAYGSPARS